MLSMLVAYNADGEVIATLDAVVTRNAAGEVIGLIEFAAHEATGGRLRDIWDVQDAVGSGTWPEWIGGRAHDFKVELDDNKRIVALVHKDSGHRRERAAIEDVVAKRIAKAKGEPADLRDLLGGPDRPLTLNAKGKTARRVKVERPALPVIRSQA